MTDVADPPAPLELRLPAVPSSVTEARIKMAQYATGAGADSDDVELAVAEAVANSVLHAFPGESKGTVTVRASFGGDLLEIQVTDDGTGMRPNPEGDGLGLGLALIGRLSASFSVSEPEYGGTRLRMSFPCGSGASANG